MRIAELLMSTFGTERDAQWSLWFLLDTLVNARDAADKTGARRARDKLVSVFLIAKQSHIVLCESTRNHLEAVEKDLAQLEDDEVDVMQSLEGEHYWLAMYPCLCVYTSVGACDGTNDNFLCSTGVRSRATPHGSVVMGHPAAANGHPQRVG